MASPESRGAIISRALDTVGDGSGTKNAVGDYSGGVEEFMIAPAAGEVFLIQRMIVSYKASASPAWQSTLYGQNIPLTNGVEVESQNSGGVNYTLTDPDHPILSNADWAGYCYDFTLFSFGSGPDQAAIRWTFAKSGSQVRLDGAHGDKLVVKLNDDFSGSGADSGLTDQHFVVQGWRIV